MFFAALSRNTRNISGHQIRNISATVIGAGPSGLITVSHLLDSNPNNIIHWIDPSFCGGRLQKYGQVPSNTKVSLFLEFAKVSPSLTKIVTDNLENASVTNLQGLDQDKGCNLKYAREFCQFLTEGVESTFKDRVKMHRGWVKTIDYSDETYKVSYCSGAKDVTFDTAPEVDGLAINECESQALFMCTGAVPIPELSSRPHVVEGCKPPQLLSVDTLLNPTLLAETVKSTDVVAVVGSSHSAILALKNLTEMETKPARILNLYIEPLKYAEHKDGWILYDNTGLKQMAATWAKENLSTDEAAAKLGVERIFVTRETQAQVYAKYMPETTFINYSIGFRTRDTPRVTFNGNTISKIGHNNKTGVLNFDGKEVPSAHGFGIGFPQETVDPVGNVETSVGIWKFSKYIRSVLK